MVQLKFIALKGPKTYSDSFVELFHSEGFWQLITNHHFQKITALTIANEAGDGIVSALLNRTLDHTLTSHGIRYSDLSLYMRAAWIISSYGARAYNAPTYDKINQEFRTTTIKNYVPQSEIEKNNEDLKKTMAIDLLKTSFILGALFFNNKLPTIPVVGLILVAQTLEILERFLEGPIFNKATLTSLKLEQLKSDPSSTKPSLPRIYGDNYSKIKVIENIISDASKYASTALTTYLLVDDTSKENRQLNTRLVGLALCVSLCLILTPKVQLLVPMVSPSLDKEKHE